MASRHERLMILNKWKFAPLLLLFAFTGCVQFGWLAGGLIPQKIPAVHEIPQLPTLVMVDDPRGALGDDALRVTLAQEVEAQLMQNNAVPRIIEQQTLAQYQRLHDERYGQIPVDQVGRDLGAAQVIHITVLSSALAQEPTLMRPAATASVKLIDVVGRKRLFPGVQPADSSMPAAEESVGYPITTRLRYRTEGREAHAMIPLIRQALAKSLGTQAGQLFFSRTREAQTGEWSDVDAGAP